MTIAEGGRRRLSSCRAVLALSAVAVTATFAPKPALAQDEATQAEARELYEEAEALYARGDFNGAIERLRHAYRLSARPLLLYNLANAYEAAGQPAVAAEHLRRYLRYAPPDEVPDIEERIEALEAPPATPEANDPEASATEPDREDGSVEQPGTGGSSLPTVGWVTAGAGIGLVALGAVFAVLAATARSDIADGCRGLCLESAEGAIERDAAFSLAADISWGVGLAAVATGLALVLFGGDASEEATAAASISIGPGSVGVHVRESF